VRDGASVVYVERVQAGIVRLGVDVRIGSRVTACSSASGHAILAAMPQPQQVAVLGAAPRRRRTETTVTERDALLARLATVRERGFAISEPSPGTAPVPVSFATAGCPEKSGARSSGKTLAPIILIVAAQSARTIPSK
jgi:DNA-binding IclR family transcriptional regulator